MSRPLPGDVDFPNITLEVVNLLPLLDEHERHDDKIQEDTQNPGWF